MLQGYYEHLGCFAGVLADVFFFQREFVIMPKPKIEILAMEYQIDLKIFLLCQIIKSQKPNNMTERGKEK